MLCLGMKRTWELDLEIVGEPGEESEREVIHSLTEVGRAGGEAVTSSTPHSHQQNGGKSADREEVGEGEADQAEELLVAQKMCFHLNSCLAATSMTHSILTMVSGDTSAPKNGNI